MQPSPTTETSRPLFPSFRFCIDTSDFQVRIGRPVDGIPILPAYCLFLSILGVTGHDSSGRGYAECMDTARELQAELARKIASFIGSAENLTTDVPGLSLHRRSAPTAPCSMTYEPSVTVMAQGRKR